MEFATRLEAGHRLGCVLRDEGVKVDLVLGLPRGGVVVAGAVGAADADGGVVGVYAAGAYVIEVRET